MEALHGPLRQPLDFLHGFIEFLPIGVTIALMDLTRRVAGQELTILGRNIGVHHGANERVP